MTTPKDTRALGGTVDLMVGPWVLLRKIGCGAFSEVWKARHNILENRVAAVKIATDSTYVRLLQQEAIAVDRLDHPNVVKVIDVAPFDDLPHLVMEYIDGNALDSIIANKQLDLPRSARIASQVLAGLQHAHDMGIIHHDLKPPNILVGPNDETKLADFGLGKVAVDAHRSMMQSTSMNENEAQALRGTLAYMPPEQVQGLDFDHRIDLYAFGVTWFQMLTGRLPAGRDELPTTHCKELPRACDEIYVLATASLERRATTAAQLLKLVKVVAHPAVEAPGVAVESRGLAMDLGRDSSGLRRITSTGIACEEQLAWAERLGAPVTWQNAFSMAFVLIPPGRFRMGRSNGDATAVEDEMPQEYVEIEAAFYAGVFPVTNQQITYMMGLGPGQTVELETLLRDRAFAPRLRSNHADPLDPCVELNVEDVSIICSVMQRFDGIEYRLPSEAEWEYAARAGSSDPYWWGDPVDASQHAVFGRSSPCPADSHRTNAWGLVDVLGNVAEWTASKYAPLRESAKVEVVPPSHAGNRVVRGGSWASKDEMDLRVSRRVPRHGQVRANWIGTRLVANAKSVVDQLKRESS
ncbi:MAG: SUMF1/EgtB/PvdO family nonheme iron enzyme [Phycisphaerales bacterium]|nr:SUMF1/EgtB/PvdO family nonheme iron enzyme [Phycisphaerales bacterium]MCB9855307.1 SUMF1/EgtB/PvdO family nonheme iron enzyme [Phycisphaerales bacterium]MCB9862900.1 SUMF1/EgtB/PvdO family nonheme iron enzyme [Phycisphaerales bacterium]